MNNGDFYEKIYSHPDGRTLPVSGSIELTARCNLNCVHCYINHPEMCQTTLGKELTCGEICALVDQIAEAGCLKLTLTGGEALLRNDFVSILRHVKDQGIIPTLFTNGTLITPSLADAFYDLAFSAVEITIPGATPETFDAITRVPGSHRKCLQGVELLRARGISVRLKTTVTTMNKSEIPVIQKFAQELGVEFRFDTRIMPRIDGSLQPCSYRLSPAEIVELDAIREGEAPDDETQGPAPGQQGHDSVYRCYSVIRHSFWIDSFGNLSLCHTSRDPCLSLREHSFAAARKELISMILSMKPSGTNGCAGCDLKSICENCAALSLLELGDRESPVPFCCETAQLRALARQGAARA